jgi:hypothetical protein
LHPFSGGRAAIFSAFFFMFLFLMETHMPPPDRPPAAQG